MSHEVKTWRQLFAEWPSDLLDEEGLRRIEVHLEQRYAAGEPWFVKALMALGAWVAAFCFVLFLAIANWIDDDWYQLFGWGAALLTGAVVLRRWSERVFPAQLALAASTMGHAFVIVGAAQLAYGDGSAPAMAAAALLVCIVLYPLYPDSLHRFLSCVVATGFLTAWIVEGEVWQLIHVEVLGKVILLGVVFLYRWDWLVLRPLGYAMAVSLPGTLLLVLLPEGVGEAPWWPANVVLTAGLVWLFQWVAGGWQRLRTEPLAIAVGTTVVLASFTTPGMLAALGLLILGYARNDRHLLASGAVFFPVFIVVFYYEWQISLLVKSWIMAGSGAVLLGTRWLCSLRAWAQEAKEFV